MTNLTNGVNLFLVGSNGLDTNIPNLNGLTASQLLDIQNNGTGINRQETESGVYLSLKSTENIDVYVLYGNGGTYGWVNTQTIDISDLDFENGHAIAWRDDETSGTAHKIKFVTTDVDAEVRLLPIKKVIITDEKQQDGDLAENFLSWYSNNIEHSLVGSVVKTKNFDGYQRLYHDLSTYSIGDTYSFEVDGYVDDAISFVRMVEDFLPTYEYNSSTQKTTISFVIPAGENGDYDTSLDIWHTWWSLSEVAQNPFMMTIEVEDKVANAWGNGFALIFHSEATYDFTVDWGDGSPIENVKTSDLTLWNQDLGYSPVSLGGGGMLEYPSTVKYYNHYYKSSGFYQIKITGVMPTLAFGAPLEWDTQSFYYGSFNQTTSYNMLTAYTGTALNQMVVKSKSMIKSIDQWGDILFNDLSLAFARCYDMRITASDYPKFDSQTNLTSMFEMDYSLTDEGGSLSKWKMENVSNVKQMFYMATGFSTDLSTKLVQLTDFDADENEIVLDEWNAWNTENIADFTQMFGGGKTNWGNTTFNDNGVDNWNFKSAQSLRGMFHRCDFNQPLVVKVVNGSDVGLNSNYEAWSFRNNINGDSIIDFGFMFAESEMNSTFNSIILPSRVNCQFMFYNNQNYNQPLVNEYGTGLNNEFGFYKGWETSKITSTESMFEGTTQFNQDLTSWFPTGSIISICKEMFKNATAFNNGNLSSNMAWNLQNVRIFTSMFENAISFNGNVEGFNVSYGTHFNNMFKGASSFTGTNGGYPLGKYGVNSSWDTGDGQRFDRMFEGCTSLNVSEFHFNMTSGHAAARMFKNCSSLTSFTLLFGNWGNGSTTGFGITSANGDPTNAQFMFEIFDGCTGLLQTSIEGILSKWNDDLPNIVGTTGVAHAMYNAYQYGQFEGTVEDLPVQWRQSESQTDRDQLVAKGWWIHDNGVAAPIPPPNFKLLSWGDDIDVNSWSEGDAIGKILVNNIGFEDYDENGVSGVTISLTNLEYENGTSIPLTHLTVVNDNSIVLNTDEFYYGKNSNSQGRIKVTMECTHTASGEVKTFTRSLQQMQNLTPGFREDSQGIHMVYNLVDTRGAGPIEYAQNQSSSQVGTDLSPNTFHCRMDNNGAYVKGPYISLQKKWFNRYVKGSYLGNTYPTPFPIAFFHGNSTNGSASTLNKYKESGYRIKKVTKRLGHWFHHYFQNALTPTLPSQYGEFIKLEGQVRQNQWGLFDPANKRYRMSQQLAGKLTTIVTGDFHIIHEFKNPLNQFGANTDIWTIQYLGQKLDWERQHDNSVEGTNMRYRKAIQFSIEICARDAWDGPGNYPGIGYLESPEATIELVAIDWGFPG